MVKVPKKSLVWVALIFAGQNLASARPQYGVAGCGLGSIVIEPSGSQTSAGTTNGSSSNQSFAITSGTSNCETKGRYANLQDQESFFIANYADVSRQMAQGSGDALAAFSRLLGCDQKIFGSVATYLQAHYAEIVKSPGALATLDAAKSKLKADRQINSRCHFLF